MTPYWPVSIHIGSFFDSSLVNSIFTSQTMSAFIVLREHKFVGLNPEYKKSKRKIKKNIFFCTFKSELFAQTNLAKRFQKLNRMANWNRPAIYDSLSRLWISANPNEPNFRTDCHRSLSFDKIRTAQSRNTRFPAIQFCQSSWTPPIFYRNFVNVCHYARPWFLSSNENRTHSHRKWTMELLWCEIESLTQVDCPIWN